MIRKLGHWLTDYGYMLRGNAYMVRHRKPPSHYLGHIVSEKPPVILLPGIFNSWAFLKKLADPISLRGHPVYVISKSGLNLKSIPESAHEVRDLIRKKDLKNVVLLAHSKGGLIGRHLLAYHNKDQRVRKMIAIGTPFAGSKIVRAMFIKSLRELDPESETVREMHAEPHANEKIVSLYSVFDNHVWPHESAVLQGAKNIQVEVPGHHRIVFDEGIRNIVIREIES